MPTSDTTAPRQLPGLDRENRAFWTWGAEGRLAICRCPACGTYHHPPIPRCTACAERAETAPGAVSGRGRVATFTINHQAWLPNMPVPFVFAAIELEEQARLYVFSNVVNCPPEAVRIGMPVSVLFEAREDVHLPLFEPAQP